MNTDSVALDVLMGIARRGLNRGLVREQRFRGRAHKLN